jgi:hypothetical protein
MIRWLACLAFLALTLSAAALAADDKKPAGEATKEPAFRMTDEEKQVLKLTNEARAKEKLPPLAPNPLLFRIARQHSANMAKKGEMAHVLDGKNPGDRVLAGGYDYRRVAENLAASDGLPPEEIMESWMKSESHRENLLRSGMEETGLGIVRNDLAMREGGTLAANTWSAAAQSLCGPSLLSGPGPYVLRAAELRWQARNHKGEVYYTQLFAVPRKKR